MDITSVWIDEDMAGALEAVLEAGSIVHETSVGIARKVIADGLDSLNEKQLAVFDRYIRPEIEIDCKRCGCPVPLSEITLAIDNGGYCGYCDHQMAKDD